MLKLWPISHNLEKIEKRASLFKTWQIFQQLNE
jgi:hypothetical protein